MIVDNSFHSYSKLYLTFNFSIDSYNIYHHEIY